jgi:hypothetical protein
MTIRILCFFIISTILIGCGGSKPQVGSVSEHPVKTSGDKNKWVSDDRTFWIEDGRMCFRVMVDNESDLSFAQRGLDGQAYTVLINAVKIRAGLEYDEAVKGSKYSTNSIGQARQSVVNAMGDVKFSDLTKVSEYWEQYQKDLGEKGVTYFYNLYGLYSISEKEFARAKDEAWDKAGQDVERQADKDAKQILDEAKTRFLNKEK